MIAFMVIKDLFSSKIQRYISVDFNLWLESKDITKTTVPLPEWAVTQLIEELGVAKFISNTECFDQKSPYLIAAAVNGFNNG